MCTSHKFNEKWLKVVSGAHALDMLYPEHLQWSCLGILSVSVPRWMSDCKLWSQNYSASPKWAALQSLTVLWKITAEGKNMSQQCLQNAKFLIYFTGIAEVAESLIPKKKNCLICVKYKSQMLWWFHTVLHGRVTFCWLSDMKEIGLTTCRLKDNGHLQHFHLAVGYGSKMRCVKTTK